jgi:hypothetical protein
MAETFMFYCFEASLLLHGVDGKSVNLVAWSFEDFLSVPLLTLYCLKRYFYFRLTELNLENQIYQGLHDSAVETSLTPY